VDKENKEDATALVVSGIQKEQTMRKVQEEEKKKKEEELILLEDELKILRSHNDEEKCLLEELERILAKERKRVEKQRKWSETQSQYRLCLDKMIRDTMHQ
jgi:DNA polymerase III delta prime subunit